MSDLFQDKADDWDTRPIPAQISEGVFASLHEHVALTEDLRVMDFGAAGLSLRHMDCETGARWLPPAY